MFDKNTITITTKEYRELLCAKHTLVLVYGLMSKEMDDKEKVSDYVHGDKYMDIMDMFFDEVAVENAGQSEDF